MNNESVIRKSPQAGAESPVLMEFMAAEKPVVLITGSAGFIGSRLAEACAAHYRVVGLDAKAQDIAGIDFIECDLAAKESVETALATVRERHGGHIASVVHLNTDRRFSGEPGELSQARSIEAAQRLIRVLRGFKVEQFVFPITLDAARPVGDDGEAEGSADGWAGWASESEPGKTFVGSEDVTWDSKRFHMEPDRTARQQLLRDLASIPTVVMWVANVYDESCHSVPIARQISRIYEKRLESYFYPGDADRGQPFVRLDDLVESFLRVIELRLELEPYEVFLIAEPDVMTYAELQEQIGELLHGEEWTTIHVPKIVAKAGAWARENILGHDGKISSATPWAEERMGVQYPFEVERTRKRLGWEPHHSLRDTLSKMVGSLKENPHRWYETNNLMIPGEAEHE
jgi:nucleoside-diphosphate-sugar epimerase